MNLIWDNNKNTYHDAYDETLNCLKSLHWFIAKYKDFSHIFSGFVSMLTQNNQTFYSMFYVESLLDPFCMTQFDFELDNFGKFTLNMRIIRFLFSSSQNNGINLSANVIRDSLERKRKKNKN